MDEGQVIARRHFSASLWLAARGTPGSPGLGQLAWGGPRPCGVGAAGVCRREMDARIEFSRTAGMRPGSPCNARSKRNSRSSPSSARVTPKGRSLSSTILIDLAMTTQPKPDRSASTACRFGIDPRPPEPPTGNQQYQNRGHDREEQAHQQHLDRSSTALAKRRR